jgi:hypothetical protein
MHVNAVSFLAGEEVGSKSGENDVRDILLRIPSVTIIGTYVGNFF